MAGATDRTCETCEAHDRCITHTRDPKDIVPCSDWIEKPGDKRKELSMNPDKRVFDIRCTLNQLLWVHARSEVTLGQLEHAACTAFNVIYSLCKRDEDQKADESLRERVRTRTCDNCKRQEKCSASGICECFWEPKVERAPGEANTAQDELEIEHERVVILERRLDEARTERDALVRVRDSARLRIEELGCERDKAREECENLRGRVAELEEALAEVKSNPVPVVEKTAVTFAFEKDLTTLLNRYSIENVADMPDFLLAEMICCMVEAIGPIVKKTLDWHGCDTVCHPRSQTCPLPRHL